MKGPKSKKMIPQMLPNPKREFGFFKTFCTTYYQYSSYESYNTTDLQASPKPYHTRYVNELIDTYQDGTDQNDYENENYRKRWNK